LAKGEKLFSKVGGWLVVFSRWLPLFPEVIACMAGLTRMPARSFHLAMACGSFPLGFVFAYIGHAGADHPTLAIVLSATLPPILWLSVQPFFRAKAQSVDGD
jgi:membrane protein DedA with SNARE-associated domain